MSFFQDGTIEWDVQLTGCLSTNVLSPDEHEVPTHGTLVAPGLNAQLHQHFFCVRLDMAVDDENGGANLTVSEVGPGRCRPRWPLPFALLTSDNWEPSCPVHKSRSDPLETPCCSPVRLEQSAFSPQSLEAAVHSKLAQLRSPEGPHWRLQINVSPMPLGPDNPYGVGFSADETEFQTEKQAIRMVNPSTSRIWKIKNPSKLNKMTGEAFCCEVLRCTYCRGRLLSTGAVQLWRCRFRGLPDRPGPCSQAGCGC